MKTTFYAVIALLVALLFIKKITKCSNCTP